MLKIFFIFENLTFFQFPEILLQYQFISRYLGFGQTFFKTLNYVQIKIKRPRSLQEL